ncbi:MAG: hydrolase, partial [Alphaproteobacteria bacterium]|nr:hydrolase [Alphaproteobacteria bacterium]
MGQRYHGPIIDAHHHLWDVGLGRHFWLADPGALKGLGHLDFMRRNYLVADYLADAGPQPIAGSVFIEAGW